MSSDSIFRDVEICARDSLDISFKYTWKIENYLKGIDDGTIIDSPPFEFNLNGVKTKWSLALRFWTDENGGRLTNPVVICLNLMSSCCETPEEVEIRYQFGVWNAIVKQYELCPFAKQQVELKGQISRDLVSVGFRDVVILDRHLMRNKDIQLFCKIILVTKQKEYNSLGLDLWRSLKNKDLCDVTLKSTDGDTFQAHKTILACRSSTFRKMLEKATDDMLVLQMPSTVLTTILQYIYTDHVEPLESPQTLLKFSHNFDLPGLKNICEKALVDSINPTNVAGLLMIADTFECDKLKQAAKVYCEENSCSIVKTLAWKVMEHINPELFEEVCQKN